jgi:hypothetical protein
MMPPGRSREHRVGRDHADAQVGAGQRRPGLKPNQPKHRMNVPRWPSAGGVRASAALTGLGVLADRGSDEGRADERADAADHVHDRRSGEVDVPVAEAEVRAERREPAAAPDPVAEDRVDHHRHEEAEDDKRRPLPALGQRPVGIVPAVSMNTIWKRNSVKMPTS